MISGMHLKKAFGAQNVSEARDVSRILIFEVSHFLFEVKIRLNKGAAIGKSDSPVFSDIMVKFMEQNSDKPWFQNQKNAFNETIKFMKANPDKYRDTQPFTRVHSAIVKNFFEQIEKKNSS